MTFVVAPNTSGLTPLYPYESSPLAKIISQSLKSSLPYQALPSNRTAKVIPFYYTTKLFANFFREKKKFIANRLNKKLFKEQIIFEFFQILIGKVANLAKIVYTL